MTYEYEAHGLVTAITDAGGATIDLDYDEMGNLTDIWRPIDSTSGHRPHTRYTYDSLGQVLSEEDDTGKKTSYVRDALGRPLSVTLVSTAVGAPPQTSYQIEYDIPSANGGLLITQVTDANGNTSRTSRDQFGQLIERENELGAMTRYSYSHGALDSIEDANGNLTTYSRDALTRLIAIHHPDGQTETFTYYANGALASQTDRKGQSISYAYDRLGRLRNRSYSTGGGVEFVHLGQKLTSVVDTTQVPTETHVFLYDPAFRVISVTQGSRGTVQYGYTEDDLVASMSVVDGPSEAYTYYPDGSVATIASSITPGLFTYTYDDQGRYATTTFPNGQQRVFEHDYLGRLIRLTNVHPSAGPLATYEYSYDMNHATGQANRLGDRTGSVATVPAQGFVSSTTKYYYDAAHRLTRVDYPEAAPFLGEIDSWIYDALGNRVSESVNGVSRQYQYEVWSPSEQNSARLISDGSRTYSYDDNGSLVSQTGQDGTELFGWNSANLLASIVGQSSIQYSYDYRGRLASSNVDGLLTTFLHDRIRLISQADSSATVFVMGPGYDEPLAMVRDGQTQYFLVDGLGSVVGLSDPEGAVTSTYTYDAWGALRSPAPASGSPFGFVARQFAGAGLMNFRQRHLDPSSGRFLQEDPLGFEADEGSSYRYVQDNPLGLFDPLGLRVLNCDPVPAFVKPETTADGPIGILPPGYYWPGSPDGFFPIPHGPWVKTPGKPYLPDNDIVIVGGKPVCVSGACTLFKPFIPEKQPPDDTWKFPIPPLPLKGCKPIPEGVCLAYSVGVGPSGGVGGSGGRGAGGSSGAPPGNGGPPPPSDGNN